MPQDLQQYFQYSPFFADSETMTSSDWERLQDKIDKIPVSLYNLMVDDKTSDFVESLTQKYTQLSVRGPDIARLIRDVVITDMFLGDMPQEIQKRLGLDPTTALEIANLTVRELFAPVLDELKQVHQERFPNRQLPQITPQTAPRPAMPQPPSPPPIRPPPAQQVSGDRGQGSGQNRQATQFTPSNSRSAAPATRDLTGQGHYQGEELSESGGNIIDLRNTK